MSGLKSFLIGLGLCFGGAMMWLIFGSILGGLLYITGEANPILTGLALIGFITMIGGPLTFWIILPIRQALKKRRSRARS